MESMMSSRNSSSQWLWNYDVFVSFRGEDTRTNFANHLLDALQRNGIYAFRDDLKLKRGEVIGEGLCQAIEHSRISIILFSTTYAASTWCLDELVKILECKSHFNQIVVPVFYHIHPSDVRKQAGSFQEAFGEHEEAFKDDIDKVNKWKKATTEAANLAGFHLQNNNNRNETEFIQEIVNDISAKLTPKKLPSHHEKEFVGIDWRMRKFIDTHMCLEADDVRIIGISGMGGIGKTTLARAVDNHTFNHFQGSSFLADVREVAKKEGNLVSLQKKLLTDIFEDMLHNFQDHFVGIEIIRRRLCHRKVLVLIDDVDHLDQLEKLASSRDCFGSGSRIIITTRDEHLLDAYGVDSKYNSESLRSHEALRLLSFKAFKSDQPPCDYSKMCNDVVNYAAGLPLALKVYGSFLYGRSLEEWADALQRFHLDADKDILDRLQISYDGLKQKEKDIFLDIAIFFKGENRSYVTKILEGCELCPFIGIQVLIEKCLIAVSDKHELLMHDLLQEMAKKIVEEEHEDPGKRSRLWKEDDIDDVLIKNMGTKKVKGITHKFSEDEKICLSAKAFSKMNKLRGLKIFNVKLPQGLDYLSNELRFLEWHGYPLRSLPSSFHPSKLVSLALSYSQIQQLWTEINILNKLKFIDLSYSLYLTKTPDFTGIPNLESLVFKGCIRLSEIHPSIGELRRLVLLNFKDCKSITSLPIFIQLESLEVLVLAGCSKLRKFPKLIGEMSSLEELDISETTMERFSCSIFQSMRNLKELSFRGCKVSANQSWLVIPSFWPTITRNLEPDCFVLPCLKDLGSLTKLNLSECNIMEGEVLKDIYLLSSLKNLNLSRNNFASLPSSFNKLTNLVFLTLNGCEKLEYLPESPPNLEMVHACHCTSLVEVSDPTKLHASVSYSFNGLNCFNTVGCGEGSALAFAMMKRYLLQGSSKNDFDICLPASEIPEWCIHQSEGSSVSAALFCDDSKNNSNGELVGVLACCIFAVDEHSPSLEGWNSHEITHQLVLQFKGPPFVPWYYFGEKNGRAISDHLWLVFVNQGSTFLKGTQFSSSEREVDEQNFQISFPAYGPGIMVKKCGIRIVYKLDMEELKQTM